MKDKNILIVDDDQIVLESCRRILQNEGFKVYTVKSAQEAIALMETERFDLLIMDVKMPKYNGIYLLEQIKRKWPLDTFSELPVIVMSGYPTQDTISESLGHGASDFLVKPFTPDELVTSTYMALQRRLKNGKTKSSSN